MISFDSQYFSLLSITLFPSWYASLWVFELNFALCPLVFHPFTAASLRTVHFCLLRYLSFLWVSQTFMPCHLITAFSVLKKLFSPGRQFTFICWEILREPNFSLASLYIRIRKFNRMCFVSQYGNLSML
jgi:hypothetical protein